MCEQASLAVGGPEQVVGVAGASTGGPIASLPKPHVLIVDDDLDMRQSLSEALVDAGYDVTAVANGQDALAHLASLPSPAVILLDLLMPVMNGWQFCQAKKRSPTKARIPVIAMSAAVSRDPASPYFIEVDDHIAKPVDLDELLAKLATFSPPSTPPLL